MVPEVAVKPAETSEPAARPGTSESETCTVSCIILTQGDRPDELKRAVISVQAQHGDPVEIVLVANGGVAPDPPHGVRMVRLRDNVGVPGGRNIGVEATTGDVVLFLDDDGWLPDKENVERLRTMFRSRPSLGIVSFRIVDPETGITQRRHVPRLRVGDPERSSDVTSFLGGACAIRRTVLSDCGALPATFFYSHEEIDLAWRALDAGYDIRYDAGSIMYHPQSEPSARHSSFYFNNARNRVWLARRRLPAALIPLYLGTWTAITMVRHRHLSPLKEWFGGFAEGWRAEPGPRRPIRWRTVWRMTRLGRPPVI
jgi:hypothetical protein